MENNAFGQWVNMCPHAMERNELNRLIAISSTTKTATMMMVWTISGLPVPVSQCRVRSLVWSVGPAGSSLPSTPFPPLLCFALLTPTLAKLGPLYFPGHHFYSAPPPMWSTGSCCVHWGLHNEKGFGEKDEEQS